MLFCVQSYYKDNSNHLLGILNYISTAILKLPPMHVFFALPKPGTYHTSPVEQSELAILLRYLTLQPSLTGPMTFASTAKRASSQW